MARAAWGSYRGIAADIRDWARAVPVGTAVMSEARLCAHYGVSRTTIRRALELVEADDTVCVWPGIGRVVGSAADGGRWLV